MAQKTNVVPEPFVIAFWSKGLFLNRQPLYSALVNVGIQVAQFHDALLDGVNIEVSDRLTLQRRPPFTPFCTQAMAAGEVALQMYSVRDADGNVYPLLDTNQNLYHMTPSTLTSIVAKSAGAGRSSVLEVGGLTYIVDGVDSVIWDGTNTHPWGVAAPTTLPMLQNTLTYPGYWIPNYQSTAGGALLDYLGNVEYGTGSGVSGVSLPVWNPTLGGFTNDGLFAWENVGPLSFWIAGLAYTAPTVVADTNGNIQLVTTAGTSGSTAPTWSTTFGGTTTDNTITWTNIGPGTVIAYAGYSYVYAFRTLSGNISTASPPSQNTGPIISSQAVAPLTITAYTVTSNILQVACHNTLVVGQSVTLNGFPNSTFLNGQTVKVISSGFSAYGFEAVFPSGNAAANEVGQAYPVITTLVGSRSTDAECNATYTITAVSLTGDVVTITCNNTLTPGLAVGISGMNNAMWLDGQTLYVNTASSTQFTADYVHADYASFPDMGTATFLAVEVYRTDDGGGIYYFDGAVENPPIASPTTYTSAQLTTGAGTNVDVGGAAWSNPSNVTSSSVYATVSEEPPGGSPSYNFLPSGNTVTGTGFTSPITGTFGVPVVVGTTAVIFFGTISDVTAYAITGVTDNLGNTWTQAVVNADNGSDPYSAQIYCYTAPITVGGTCTVSIAYSGSTAYVQLAGQTYSGMSTTIDVTAGNYYYNGAGGNPASFDNSNGLLGQIDTSGSAFFTTTNANDVVFTAVMSYATTGQVAPPGYTNAPSNTAVADQQLYAAWNVANTAAEYQCPWMKTDTESYSRIIGVTVAFELVPYSTGSDWLLATNFGFAIPGGVDPLGISITFDAEYNGAAGDGTIYAQLLKAGVPTGNLLSVHPASSGTYTLGGTANLWGTSWSFNDFNQTNWGVLLAANLQTQSGGPFTTGIRNVKAQINGDIGTIYWTFNDILPDSLLDNETTAELGHLNDPPPGQPGSTVAQGGNLLAYWSNRLWMAVGNYLYFCGGPDILNGVSEECFPPANVWTFPGTITGLEPSTGGLIVTTSAEYWAIMGGPTTLTYYPERIFGKFGVNSPNCIAQDGDNLFVYTTQNQCMSLVGQNRTDIGLPIAPLFVSGQSTSQATVTPFYSADSFIAVHRMGEDVGVWLSNGMESLLRFSLNLGSWSTVYQPLISASANLGFVQSNATMIFTSTKTYPISYNSAVTKGNLLIAAVNIRSAPVTPTVVDTLGSTWTLQVDATDNNDQSLWVFTAIAPTSGANTVSVSLSGSFNQTSGAIIAEYSGVNTVDQKAWVHLSTTTPDTPSITTTVAHEAIVAIIAAPPGPTVISSPFVTRQIQNPGSSTPYNAMADRFVTATGTYNANATSGFSDALAVIISFYAAPANASVGAMNSVETAPGIFTLLAAPIVSGGYVYERNLSPTSYADNGNAYSANAVVGSIVMSNPGTDLVPVHAVSVYCANVGNVPKVSFLPNEIYATTKKPFINLPVVQNEVGQLPPTQSIMAKRYPTLSNVTATPILIRHLQVKVDFGTDTVQNELQVLGFKNNKESAI